MGGASECEVIGKTEQKKSHIHGGWVRSGDSA